MQQVKYLHNLHKKWICIHVYTWRIYLTTYVYRYRVLQNLSNITIELGSAFLIWNALNQLVLWSAQPSTLFVDVAKTSAWDSEQIEVSTKILRVQPRLKNRHLQEVTDH